MTDFSCRPLEFHRMARSRPRYRWWRPVLTGLLAAALYAGMIVAVMLPFAIAGLFSSEAQRAFDSFAAEQMLFDLERPWLIPVAMTPIILLVPALLLASRVVQGPGLGALVSVAGRWRWRWLARTTGVAFALFALSFIAQLGLSMLLGEPLEFRAAHPGAPIMLLLVVLIVPFQCAAEEYVFRGYLMQVVGGWLRHPAFAILLPVPLFVLGHGYDLWGAWEVGLFAVVAGWLSWRTGGIEAAVSMHIAVNVLIFVLATFGLTDGNATEGSPEGLIAQAITQSIYAVIVVRLMRRDRIAQVSAPPFPAAESASAPQAASSSASMIV